MGREHTSIDPNMAILAGNLGPALRMHAAQRAEYFFLYLFFHRLLTRRLTDTHGVVGLRPNQGVTVKATHQIATGIRSKDSAYYAFDKMDPDMLNKPATTAEKRDAAHFCNLGVDGKFLADATSAAAGDPQTLHFIDRLCVMAGATRELPQRINIGPDRVIDKAHGEMAMTFLGDGPPVTAANFARYLTLCRARMIEYQKSQTGYGHAGLAACCGCYIDFYDGSPLALPPRDPESQWRMIIGFVEAECSALGLDVSVYLNRAVR